MLNKKSNEVIFVFGSNLAGRHGAGAAKTALLEYGACYGVGEGRSGKSYATPTKDEYLNTRSLEDIRVSVERFIEYARLNQDLIFYVTRVGCGLAGYTNEDIAPLFRNAPNNCYLDESWISVLAKT